VNLDFWTKKTEKGEDYEKNPKFRPLPNNEILEAFEKVSKMYGWKMHFGSDGYAILKRELSKYIRSS